MKRILVNKPIHNDALDLLSQELEVLTPFKSTPEEILELLPSVQAMILCAGMKMDAAAIAAATSLEVIGRHGAGLDIVDIPSATERGIPVVFTPLGPTESTAEHAFMLMMAVARKLTFLDRSVRNGNFHVRDHVVGTELKDKKVGVVGFGNIGRRFAEMCRNALHMEIYAYDPFIDSQKITDWGATARESVLEMASNVDFLSLHIPATKDTHHIVNTAVLEALGPDGFLINCARGPVVDEKALLRALKEDKIAGAALDVYDPEPPLADNPLFELDNVVLTPHLASFTDEGRRRMGLMVAEDVLNVLCGETPRYLANPEVFEK
ncbi:MAG: hydroxyacid dehydrogenase [Anaerolineaceae bacterium]|nr:hydroxyacid dehydrogenase [Anaerolineaceae bacterium]